MEHARIKHFMLATGLLFSAAFAYASDLSLHPQGKNFHLVAFSPAPATPGNAPLDGLNDVSIQEFDVWERIRLGYSIPDLEGNPRVAAQRKWYASRPDYIQRTTERASRYLFYIVQELEARGMPTELALLPFIESAFNPHARSHAKAVGMWQFMPGTGKKFNLNQSSLKDERRNVLASTEAALNYLQKLYNMFGDWQIALAAYNCGEGSVQKAIRRTRAARKPITFNNLARRMPRETRDYVPKLQAVKDIVFNPAKYGITLPKVENQPFFVTINKTHDMDVQVAARLAELPIDDFRALNPQFGYHVITGGSKTILLLPKQNADTFKTNLEKWNGAKKPLSSWTAYTVTKPREKVEEVAAQFNTTPENLREINHIPTKMLLKQGSTLLVPKSEKTPQQAQDQDIAPELAEKATIATIYDGPPSKRIKVKVRKRDTLISIARRYRGVTPEQIKSWNRLESNKLVVGSRLEIYVPYRIAKHKKQQAKNRKKTTPLKKTAAKATQKESG
ncbi:MAG: LysM peptidoglycan-binding domain-containing protein [Oxalobacter sp.]|nr:MAG: LysM peptidoglycan-binding domain-containing protein [Oxalobacter sp.]